MPTDRASSLFVRDRDLNFIMRVNTELIETISQQKIKYYAIDADRSTVDEFYGESSAKIYRQPVEIYCLILYNEPIIETGTFSTESRYFLKFYIQKYRVEQDIKVVARIGDFVEFAEHFYEISSVKDSQLVAGLDVSGYKLGTYCEAISTRDDVFNPKKQSVLDPTINQDIFR